MRPLELPRASLTGWGVRLEPFAPRLEGEVRAALDRDPDAWSLFLSAGFGEHFDAWWTMALQEQAAGLRLPYAVRRLSDGEVLGTTSFLNLRPEHRGVEIGSTFYRPEARGGAVNPDCKLTLMSAAFDGGALRVEFLTDARNLRSQAALARLGAVREGVLRRHKVTWTGHVRDTMVFAVTDEEWPTIRARLEARLTPSG